MSTELRPAVFFDRDGTLITAPVKDGKPGAIRSVEEMKLVKDAAAVCGELKELGVPLYVFTNQPDVVRGLTTQYVVEQINGAVQSALGIDEVAVSWSDDPDDPLRKPNPGLLTQLAEKHGLDLAESITVGDRWRDIEAGQRAGTKTVFIDRGYTEKHPDKPDLVVHELGEALDWIRETLGV
ncbi:MAG: HAD-IIIA family hydrolase [Solirubrobacteraceae bacterium]|nr:HAD-IIIA family hydrolase [Patulibacter sp.]